MAGKSKGGKDILPGFVIPPPPSVPMPGQFQMPQLGGHPMLQQGSLMPRSDFGGHATVAMPTPTVTQADLAGMQPDPQLMDGLRSTMQLQQGAMTQAQNRLQNINNEKMPMPTYQPSGFDQMLQQQLQSKILESLSGGEGFGGRFDRGFEMGQKIAGAVVVPAIGAFSGGAGAQGALMATESLKRDVKDSRAARAQEKSQQNQILANLASLYQNVSPTSAKNSAALMAQQVQAMRFNQQVQEGASRDLLTAANNVGGTQKDLLDLLGKSQTGQLGVKKEMFDQGSALTQATQRENQQKAHETEAQARIRQGEQHLMLQEAGLQQGAERMQLDAAGKNASLQDSARNRELSASDKIASQARMINDRFSAVGANGKPRFANWGDYFQQNPVEAQALAKLAKAANIDVTPEEIMGAYMKTAPAAPQGPDLGAQVGQFLGGVGNAAMQGGQAVLGGANALGKSLLTPAQPAAKPVVVPDKDLDATIAARLEAAGQQATPELIEQIKKQLGGKK